ncbi:MAG: hypothetical protein JW909_01545 [Planctomycetes bacterium]|nr:hypothetical protein [Planctomycetota bacterium]
MPAIKLVGILLAGIGTLAIYSFLYRENKFYRLFEHVFIGVGVGIGVIETTRRFLIPELLQPLYVKGLAGLAVSRVVPGMVSPFGVSGAFVSRIAQDAWQPAEFLWLVPAVIGSLYYTIYSRRYNWLARLVIGLGIGAAGGAAFEGIFTEMLPQIYSAFRPIVVFEMKTGGIDWGMSLINVIMTVSMICTMLYFIFTIDRKKIYLERAASTGRLLMMISFGAIFGATVTARMALVIERIQYLTGDWAQAVFYSFYQVFGW